VILVRFQMRCRSDSTDHVLALLRDVVEPSRAVEGVISFDIGRDVTDPDAFVATEVFEDRDALDRQESLPEVARVMAAFEAEPEATIFHVSSAEPCGD
jgi:quinol monooxygenase YgiN